MIKTTEATHGNNMCYSRDVRNVDQARIAILGGATQALAEFEIDVTADDLFCAIERISRSMKLPIEMRKGIPDCTPGNDVTPLKGGYQLRLLRMIPRKEAVEWSTMLAVIAARVKYPNSRLSPNDVIKYFPEPIV